MRAHSFAAVEIRSRVLMAFGGFVLMLAMDRVPFEVLFCST
jgi:hypothetical protein